MFAQIVVDVPAGQTDRLFDYKVPESLQGAVSPGMRVVVPFGPRKLQGFIIRLTENTTVKKVRNIDELLDVTPVLTPELLDLGSWLSEETICYQITAYQSMIPAAMRAKAKKVLYLQEEIVHFPVFIQTLFGKRSSIEWNKVPMDKDLLSLIRKEVRDGRILLEYEVKDQARKQSYKTIQVTPKKSREELEGMAGNRAKKQLEALRWLLEHYPETPVPLKQVEAEGGFTRAVLQALVEKGCVVEKTIEQYRDPFKDKEFQKTVPLSLTNDQAEVLHPVREAVGTQTHETFLLRGVTGSGKTEVYLQAIQKVIEEGKEAIVLVPEISLTPQMVNRFKSRFGSQVAVLHSALSIGEKYDEWRKIQRKEVKVAVGARSAVFAPFEKLGLIIIDEEHEGSYKQEDHPRYHAKDVAIWRGRYHKCPVLLGSATPSLESFARAQKGVYRLLELNNRVNNFPMPEVELVDMREELKNGNRSVFSNILLEKLEDRLQKGEQVVLFLNRRGYSTFVMCRSCGFVTECPHCEISLTYHHVNKQLKCHYCGHEESMVNKCPSCDSEHIRFFGTGTQKVEEELTRLLPTARVIRMDVDTTSRKGAHEKLLTKFGSGQADILLGTQMIAKGLDFPNITLAGVLAADTLLNLPDFRAPERTFQLLTQVSGRAGRDKLKGEVVIQTYNPEHYSIVHAKEHDFLSFSRQEMTQRKVGGYPPYFFLALITVSHEDLSQVITTSEKIASHLRERLSIQTKVLGPTVSPIARLKDRYRYQCMIKYRNEPDLTKTLREIADHFQSEMAKDKLFISIDMNPHMFM
ncbi:primosomal protein N' [Thalassorhabdus alkalitolerans]|uniref:Replication restart protein PriA n=2 Tax=Thalassorhabdus alkalitolerans TaxID=2282697 RepID=A0ABW0YJB7_9BACI